MRGRLRLPIALKYPDFRRYWLALFISVTGYQMLIMFSLGWLILNLTDDTRFVGYLGFSIAAPAILLNLFGGVFADKLSPGRVLGLTQSTTAIVVFALAVLRLRDAVDYRHVLGGAFLIGAVQAFDEPIRQSVWPRLVEPAAFSNAVALNSVIWTGTRLIGPPLAAGVIEWASISTALFVSAVGFTVLAVVSQTLTFRPVERARGRMFREMRAGFLYLKSQPVFLFLIGMTCFNSMFGMSYLFLMPVMAKEVFDVGPEKIGLLMGVSAIGSVTVAATAANLRNLQFRGTLIVGCAVMFGTFLMLFALTSSLGMYGLSMPVVLLAGGVQLPIHNGGDDHPSHPGTRRIPREGNGVLLHHMEHGAPWSAPVEFHRTLHKPADCGRYWRCHDHRLRTHRGSGQPPHPRVGRTSQGVRC